MKREKGSFIGTIIFIILLFGVAFLGTYLGKNRNKLWRRKKGIY